MVQKFNFERLSLKDAVLIHPFIATDDRGAFIKDYSSEIFSMNNIQHELKEVFYTESMKGVIRAIHFQTVKEQSKLVRCISGEIYDIIVDLRPNSPTYKKWLGFILSGENKKSIYVPKGFGHGYLVLKDSVVSYKCDEKFYPEYDSGIVWNDLDLNINWPLDNIPQIILSDKDKNLQTFEEFHKKALL